MGFYAWLLDHFEPNDVYVNIHCFSLVYMLLDNVFNKVTTQHICVPHNSWIGLFIPYINKWDATNRYGFILKHLEPNMFKSTLVNQRNNVFPVTLHPTFVSVLYLFFKWLNSEMTINFIVVDLLSCSFTPFFHFQGETGKPLNSFTKSPNHRAWRYYSAICCIIATSPCCSGLTRDSPTT